MERYEAMAPRKQPNPIDVHVGSRLKQRRTAMAMTQEKLGDQLGVTFQQVQKYEKGANRIGASRLQEIAGILEVPVSYFFENAVGAAPNTEGQLPQRGGPARYGGAPAGGEAFGFAEDQSARFEVPGDMNRGGTSEAHALARAFSEIGDARVRRRVLDLVETLADASPNRY